MNIKAICEKCGTGSEVVWNGTTSHMAILKRCPQCGGQRKIVFPEREERSIIGSISIGKIDGMTPAQRKELLKKRSTADFHKNIEAKKRWMDKQL